MEQLTIPASLTRLGQVAAFITTLGDRGNLTSQAAYRLRLATDEIVTNIMMHTRADQICIRGGVAKDKVWVEVANWGPMFDPRVKLKNRIPCSPRGGEIGGLGLFLAFEAVDEFAYEFVDGINKTIFSVRRDPPPGKQQRR
jgi:serine/threonine-protein kinase RsbW